MRDFLEKDIGVPAAKIHVIHEFPIAICKDDVDQKQRKAIRNQFGIHEDAFVIGMCGTQLTGAKVLMCLCNWLCT